MLFIKVILAYSVNSKNEVYKIEELLTLVTPKQSQLSMELFK